MTPEERITQLEQKLAQLTQTLQRHQYEYSLHRHTETDRTRALYPYAYYGRVESDGTATNIPDGWSVSHTGTGRYTITHNLGHTNYAVVAIVDWQDNPSNNVAFATIATYSATSFQINTINRTAAAADADYDFFFILVKRTV